MRLWFRCCIANIKFIVKVLVIVNDSPWGSSLAITALRMVRSLLAANVVLDSVYFRGDGVYHAIRGRSSDSGTADLPAAWLELAAQQGFPLMLCKSACLRRLDCVPPDGFREAGLAEMIERMGICDRVVTF